MNNEYNSYNNALAQYQYQYRIMQQLQASTWQPNVIPAPAEEPKSNKFLLLLDEEV